MNEKVLALLGELRIERELLEGKAQKMEEGMRVHKHGFFCIFPWSTCQREKQTIADMKVLISSYCAAEKGLASGDYSDAIRLMHWIVFQLTTELGKLWVASPPAKLEEILDVSERRELYDTRIAQLSELRKMQQESEEID